MGSGVSACLPRERSDIVRGAGAALEVASTVLAVVPDPLGVNGALSRVLDVLKQRCDGAVTNTENCRKLWETAKWSRECLEGAPEAAWAEVEHEKSKLEAALNEACEFLTSFDSTNWMKRALHATRDANDFTRHSEAITVWTLRLAAKLAIKGAAAQAPPEVSYNIDAESEKLRVAICELGGDVNAESALMELTRQGRLGELTRHMKLDTQVQMAAMEEKFGSLAVQLLEAANRVKLPEALPPGLKAFWWDNFNATEVRYSSFCEAVMAAVKAAASGQHDSPNPKPASGFFASMRAVLGTVPKKYQEVNSGGGDSKNGLEDERLLKQLVQAYTDPDGTGLVGVDAFYQFWLRCQNIATSLPPGAMVPDTSNMLNCCKVLMSQPRELENAGLCLLAEVLSPCSFTPDVDKLLTRFLPGSRTWLFDEFRAWLELGPEDPGHRAMVLYGEAGLGKSTVAAALVGNKAAVGPVSPVVGHFFCKQNDRNRSDPVLMIRTLAYQLAKAVPALRPHLLPPELTARKVSELANVETAFQRLLLEPLKKVKEDLSSLKRPLVLVIDALDEVAAEGSTLLGANPVLRLIREEIPHLPPAVRFVFTSRPKAHIKNSMDAAFRKLTIEREDPRHIEDLGALVKHELRSRLEGSGGGKPTTDETRKAVQLLQEKSEGVFAYLARLLDSLKGKSRWSLADLGAFPQDLNATCKDFVAKHLGSSDRTSSAGLSRLLSVLLAAQEPLTVELLTTAWNAAGELPTMDGGGAAAGGARVAEQMPPEAAAVEVRNLLGQLGPLYSILDDRVFIFHKLFNEFLERSKVEGESNSLCVDPVQGHTLLAATAVPLMVSSDALTAWCSAEVLPGSSVQQPSSVSPYALRYGLHHLVELHLSDVSAAGPLLMALVQNYAFLAASFSSGCGHDLIRALLRLSLTPNSHAPAIVLESLRWLLLCQADLVRDGGVNEEDVLASSMRCPMGTMIYKLGTGVYSNKMQARGRPHWTTTRVLGAAASWPACQMVLEGHTRNVLSVSWSPDGRHLASGSLDKSIRVWDATSGECLAILKEHIRGVQTVTWSPDSRKLASGSGDKSIRVWDAASGTWTIAAKGHTGPVQSVTWSPDGRQLASGSEDKSIRVWDASNGACLASLKDELGRLGRPDEVESKPAPPSQPGLTPKVEELLDLLRKRQHQDIEAATVGIADVRALVIAMMGGKEAELQRNAAIVLRGLLSKSDANRKVVAESGAIKPLVEALSIPNLATQFNAAGILGDLALDKSNQAAIAQAGGIPALVALQLSSNAKVQKQATAALKVLEQGNAANKAAIVQEIQRGAGHLQNLDSAATVPPKQAPAAPKQATPTGPKPLTAIPGHPAGQTAAKSGTPTLTKQATTTPANQVARKAPKTAEAATPLAAVSNEYNEMAHTGNVQFVTWSPDGRQLASGNVDNTIRVWDAVRHSCVATLEEHTGRVLSVAWSPDGKKLASGSKDSTIRVWDVISRACMAKLEGHRGTAMFVSWSPDGRMLAGGHEDSTIQVWDVVGYTCVATLEGHLTSIRSLAWSSDGRKLASGSDDKSIRVWDVARGVCVERAQGHTSSVLSVAWSPDGRKVASGSEDKSIRVWDAASGKCVATLEGQQVAACCVTWSPDGRQLASGSDDMKIHVWSIASGMCVSKEGLKGHTGSVLSVAWSLDGRQLASGSEDKSIRVWDASSYACVTTLKGHAERVQSVIWSPDSRQLVSGSEDKSIRVWDAASGKCVAKLEGHKFGVWSVSWSPDGQQLASGSGDMTIRVWNMSSRKCVAILKGHTAGVASVMWSPYNLQLASGSYDKSIRVWDAANCEAIAILQGHTRVVTSASWSPDGRQLASGSEDKSIRFWCDSQLRSLAAEREAGSVVQLPDKLPSGLKEFWLDNFNTEAVPYYSFFVAVMTATKVATPKLVKAVRQRVDAILGPAEAESLAVASDRQGVQRLLKPLLQAYIDPDGNNRVGVDAFCHFWFSCREWALLSKGPEPTDLLSCCEVLTSYFEPKMLLESEKAALHRLAEVLRPLNFTADTDHLLTRFLPGSRAWIFEQFREWLELGPEDPGHRAMVLHGRSGMGKSIVAAAMVAKKVVAGPASAVVGHYFFKYNDKHHSDPVLMIRTLAYQLAEAVPALRPHLLSPELTSQMVSAVADVETAFQRLLLEPLKKVKADLLSRQLPLVLVIDALDEVAVAGSTLLGANPVLRLIREEFPQLPSAVRFVFTSCSKSHIINSLDATIRPLKIKCEGPRHIEDLRALLHHEIGGRLEGSGGGEPTADEVSEAVQLLLDKCEGAFVYLEWLRDSLKAQSRWSLSDLGAFPQGLNAAYTEVFYKRVGIVGSIESPKFADIRRLLSVLLAAQDLLTVELLTAAWNSGGELSSLEGGGEAAGREGVVKRMRPEAAVEAVNKLLRQLRSLYSVLSGRVVVFHKSFHDFLESPQLAGDFWVDSFEGHALLTALAAPLMKSVNAARMAWPPAAGHSVHQLISVPSYTLRYGPHHLVELQLSGKSPASGPLLEALVQNHAFLAAAFSCGCGHDLIRALLRLRQPTTTTTSTSPAIAMETLRWLLLHQEDLNKAGGISEDAVIASAMRCPIGTTVFKVAKEEYTKRRKSLGRPCWTPALVLGAGASWPAYLMELQGHTELLWSVSWSPDGRQLASGSDDKSIRVWDAGSGACVATLKGHTGSVCSVSWSPDGRQLASGSVDKSIRVWDAGSGACVATLEGHTGSVCSVKWSPDGRQLASGSKDKSIRVWDAGSGACVATLEGRRFAVYSVSWSPDGRQLARGSKEKNILVWDAGSGALDSNAEGIARL